MCVDTCRHFRFIFVASETHTTCKHIWGYLLRVKHRLHVERARVSARVMLFVPITLGLGLRLGLALGLGLGLGLGLALGLG